MRKRIYKKQFWLNEEEVTALRKKSSKANMNESDFIRALLLDYEVKEKPDDRFYEYLKYMRSISNSLNQIARKANSLDFIDYPFYKREAEKVDKFILEIKDKFLSLTKK